MSKALFAFLGTNDYLACNYELKDMGKVSYVRFIQEAVTELKCTEWTENDRIVIFLTSEARKKNWNDDGQKDKDGKVIRQDGLETRLNKLKSGKHYKWQLKTVDVPDGKTEEDIWEIFQTVYETIGENEEVTFDITHGFRSLPMLLMVILNYARMLKNISVPGIYYGAFETLGPIYKVRQMDIEDRNAPIFDLTGFTGLFEWTTAINNFVEFGDAKHINSLTNKNVNPYLAKDTNARKLRDFARNLLALTEVIQTNRGADLLTNQRKNKSGFRIQELQDYLNRDDDDSMIKPLQPLLDKINQKIEGFEPPDPVNINNGYKAVRWCIDHNLIQQGYTILQETLVTEKQFEYFGNINLENNQEREFISNAIKKLIHGNKKPEDDKDNDVPAHGDEIIEFLIRSTDEEWLEKYNNLSSGRNDINHAGMRTGPAAAKTLKKNLEIYYNFFIKHRKTITRGQ